MNSFCEECGHPLASGDRFCQECGTPAAVDDPAGKVDGAKGDITFDFFSGRIKVGPDQVQGHAAGIIFTNFDNWDKKLGTAETARLKQAIGHYTEQLREAGIFYLVLDAADNDIKKLKTDDWKKHVQLLTKAIKRVKRKLKQDTAFTMLFGGHEIIPMPRLENPLYDGSLPFEDRFSDRDLDSDMPYSSLSVYPPEKKESARTPIHAVGRIPSGSNTTVDDLVILLNNTLESFRHFSTANRFSMSAYHWRGPSGVVNSGIEGRELKLSPDVTLANIAEHYHSSVNVHYFNLHGSDEIPFWIGDDGLDNPYGNDYSAFSPDLIMQCTQNNILGVEACYGACFIGLKKEDSMLLSALASKTVSFAGSSRIAMGPAGPEPHIGLADIAILFYLKAMLHGYPAGEAMRLAREQSFKISAENGSDFKTCLLTMLQFNLFGDPAFVITVQKQKAPFKAISEKKTGLDADEVEEITEEHLADSDRIEADPKSGPQAGFSSDPLSPLSAVRRAVDETQQRIIQRINEDVWSKYPAFKGITPTPVQYGFEGKNYYRLNYVNNKAKYGRYLMVNHDLQGKILFSCTSK